MARYEATRIFGRIGPVVKSILVLALLVLQAAHAGAASPSAARAGVASSCPDSPTDFATVADVGADLRLTLEDGRVLSLAGIESPRPTKAAPDRPRAVHAGLVADLGGRPIGFAPLGPTGRWGAIPAIVFAESGALGEALLVRGDVRMRPDRSIHPCRADLLAAEEHARTARLGVWADAALAPIDAAGDLPRENIEGMVLVEGVVVSSGETPGRLYLNLGRVRGGFAISLPKRDIALMQSDAVTKARIKGTRVRVRGLVDRFAGWRVDVSDADAIEILAPVAPDTASQAR